MVLHPKKINQKMLDNPKFAKAIKAMKADLPTAPASVPEVKLESKTGSWFDIDARSPEVETESKTKKKAKKDSQ